MPCNSTGGGGAAYAANTGSQVTFTPQNSEWPIGMVDGYLNTDSYSVVNGIFGSDPHSKSLASQTGAAAQWLGGLTNDEKNAVYEYTFDQEGFNKPMRDGTVALQSKVHQKEIKALESALSKGELPVDMIMHRGSTGHLITGQYDCTLADIKAKAGQIVADAAFTSTATVKGGGFSGNVIYHIKTPAGKGAGAYVDTISAYKGPGESEFLFNSGSKFRVLGGYEDSKGKLHCNLEYVGRA